MKKLILCVLAVFMLSAYSVSALGETVDCSYNNELGKTVICGEAEAGELVSVRIFKKKNHLDENGNFSLKKAKSDLSAAFVNGNIQTVLCYADQVVANSENKYSFNVKIARLLDSLGNETDDALSEVYAVVLKSASGEIIEEYLFVDPAERAADYRTLSQMKESTKENVIAFLKEHKYSLGIYAAVLDEMDSEKAYNMLYDYLKSESFNVADLSDDAANEAKNTAVMADLQKTLVIEAVNQDKVLTIKDYEDELMILSGELSSWYAKSLVDDDFKLAVTERLTDTTYEGIADFDDALREAVILEFFAFSDGVDDCVGIIEAFKTDIGFDEDDKILENAVRAAMGEKFDDYDELKDTIDGYKEESGKKGGGSGGSGSSSKKYSSIALPAVNQATELKPINNNFSDLSEAPYAIEAINYLTENGIISGRGDGTFAPNDNVTRAEFVKILVNAFGFTDKADIAFSDVAEDSWYCDFIKIAVKNGLAGGMSSEYFGANENITRQDMAVMLYNAAKIAKSMASNDDVASFTDEGEIAPYAKEAVSALTEKGIINGLDDGSFAPKALATRAQAAKIVYGLLIS